MIDVGGAALLGAAARNCGRRRGASPTRRTTRGSSRELRELGVVSAETAGPARRRGVQHGRRLPRRDRRLPQPDLRQHLPEPPGDRPREGRRPALRREPAPARRRSTARRRTAAGRSPTRPSSRASRRRSTTCSTSTPRTGSPATTRRRRSRSSSTPTRSGWPRTTSSSRPTGTRSRPTRSPRSAGSSAVNRELDGATAREIAANSYEAVVAPGLQPGGARDPARQARPRAARRPARPDRGDARLRHRQPRLQADRRRAARRDPGRARARPRPAPGRDEAPADARGADRPALRLAGGPPRPLERDRPRPQRRDGRDRGRARPAARSRSRSPCAGPATGPSSRSWRRDAYFPFPDGIQAAARAGVTAIIQPGGSIRDEMAIEVADRHHLAMVFTGRRHFRH